MNQARFQKQQREKARKDKAAAKSARRVERAERAAEEALGSTSSTVPQHEVLDELADLHRRFEAQQMSFEDFEEARTRLLERLHVE